MRSDAEAWGLSALIALSRARQRGPGTEYVPLDEQDPASWDATLIDRGEAALRRASALAVTPGRFQLEAALQLLNMLDDPSAISSQVLQDAELVTG